jgi:hypothetical protein
MKTTWLDFLYWLRINRTTQYIIFSLLSHIFFLFEFQGSLGGVGYAPLNMLGVIQVIQVLFVSHGQFISITITELMFWLFQAQKTAELLLDLKVNSIICSPQVAAVDTATAICEVNIIFIDNNIEIHSLILFLQKFHLCHLISWSYLQVQEAADCLGADCVPRDIEMKNLLGLEIDDAFQTKQKVRPFPVCVVYHRHRLLLYDLRIHFCAIISWRWFRCEDTTNRNISSTYVQLALTFLFLLKLSHVHIVRHLFLRKIGRLPVGSVKQCTYFEFSGKKVIFPSPCV